jgi:hypothetical protein
MTNRRRPTTPDAEVPGVLKAAVQDLVANIGGDGFLMELQTDDGQRYYLAFGKPDMLRSFMGSLPDAPPVPGQPSIH